MQDKLQLQLNDLSKYISQHASENNNISAANVGWHIEHLLLTINAICDELTKSDPADYKRKFSLIKLLVMTVGKIPRGKAKAPKIVRPSAEITQAYLENHLSNTTLKLQQLPKMPSDKFFPHPYFGHLKTKEALRFLNIHNTHHLNIIKDVIPQ